MFENTIYEFRKELENLGYCQTVVKTYPKYVVHFFEFTKEIPTQITANQIKIYQAHLREKPNQAKDGKLSQSHVHSQLLAIRIYFEYLEESKKSAKILLP